MRLIIMSCLERKFKALNPILENRTWVALQQENQHSTRKKKSLILNHKGTKISKLMEAKETMPYKKFLSRSSKTIENKKRL